MRSCAVVCASRARVGPLLCAPVSCVMCPCVCASLASGCHAAVRAGWMDAHVWLVPCSLAPASIQLDNLDGSLNESLN